MENKWSDVDTVFLNSLLPAKRIIAMYWKQIKKQNCRRSMYLPYKESYYIYWRKLKELSTSWKLAPLAVTARFGSLKHFPLLENCIPWKPILILQK